MSLTVEDGDFITIVGSNGAGKSTLFHAIAGVFYVDGGSIVLDGEDITYKPEYRRSREMGRLFQDPMRGTAPHMTIEENLALAYLRTAKHQNAFFSRTSSLLLTFFVVLLATSVSSYYSQKRGYSRTSASSFFSNFMGAPPTFRVTSPSS